MIYLQSIQLQQMSTHVEACYPEEGCGLLVGSVAVDRKQVEMIIPTKNVWMPDFMGLDASTGVNLTLSKLNRFAIEPRAMLLVQRESRDRHQQIIGVFHSHPDAAAIPSEFDQAIAWPEYVYLILRVDGGNLREIRGWQLDGQDQFQGEPLLIAQDADDNAPL